MPMCQCGVGGRLVHQFWASKVARVLAVLLVWVNVKVKVKVSHYRPRQTVRDPGG